MVRNAKLAVIIGLVITLLIAAFPANLAAQNIQLSDPGFVFDSQAASSIGAGDGTLATGLKEPTASDREWMKRNFPVIKEIRPNALALERINLEREAKGLKKLSGNGLELASFGDEMVLSPASSTVTSMEVVNILPASVDNSALPAFPPIRSQGGIGSCAAWAATYYQFTFENNMARGYTASSGDNTRIFSPKFTYNMVNGGADNGSYFSAIYAVEMKNGAARWADFPYDSNYLQWPLNASTWREALNYRPLTWGQITGSDVGTLISNLKTQISNGHVIVIATYVSSWAQKLVANDPSTGEDDAFAGQKIAGYLKNTNLGGHGMTIVGYNDNLWCDLNANGKVDSGEKGAFKIANSWGTSDWNRGYRWVSYDAMRSSSAVSSSGTWPAADRSSSGIFWSGNYFTLTARGEYTPSLLAEVTLNHAKRGQMSVSLGTSGTLSTTPSSTWSSGAVNYSGGNWAFNGTTSPVDGTFVFDFSDLDPSFSKTRWFAGITDSAAGSAAVIKSFKLYRGGAGGDTLFAASANVPKVADGSRVYSWVDNSDDTVNQPPVAVAVASKTSGYAPLTVSFDGSASRDTDGSIVSYKWQFGDSASATGAKVSHVYTTAGTFTVTLSVTDDKGAAGTASLSVKVTQTSITVMAPSKAKAAAVNGYVTLTWQDNSGNEEGFYIERAVKSGTAYSAYTRVGTVSANVNSFGCAVDPGIYRYRIQAFNQTYGKVSSWSNVVSLTVADPTIINAPSKLTAKTLRRNVTLTWKDNSGNEEGFYIERAVRLRTGYSAYVRVGTVAANTLKYSNTAGAGAYKYRIQAFNLTTGKVSPFSNTVSLNVR